MTAAASLLARVGVSCATTSTTSPLALGAALGAVAPNLCPWMDFPTAGAVDGKTYRYLILDSNGGWEIGKGVYTASGTTIARTTIKYSSNANAAISLSGNSQVFIAPIPDDLLSLVDDQTALFTASERAQGRVNLGAAMIAAMAMLVMNQNIGMELAQENGTSAVTLTGTGATQITYLLDGVKAAYRGTFVATASQVTDAPAGFLNSLKFTVGTAQASLGANDELSVILPIEGYRAGRLAYGTANATALAVWFWVKAHRTGAYSGSLRNATSARSYPFSFTINSADTWEFKSVLVSTGDTTGTWATDNTVGLFITICIAGGSSRVGTAATWAAADFSGATSTTNGVAATSDVFQVTGIGSLPLIAGVTVGDIPLAAETPFIVRPQDTELLLAQRHFWQWKETGGTTAYVMGGNSGQTTTGIAVVYYPVPMRAAPTITAVNPTHFSVFDTAGTPIALTALASTGTVGTRSAGLLYTVAAGLTVGRAVEMFTTNTDAAIKFDARL